MPNIILEELNQKPVEQQRVELVERKGTGHPDTMCDAIMEQASVALCRVYLDTFGRILHHNLDKAMLVAGRSEPRLGGGRLLEPMRLVFGDRATAEYRGKRIDVGAMVEGSARDWLRHYLQFVDPEQHIVFQNEVKEGSAELTDIFERPVAAANDTSAAVAYAPLSETERLVMAAERYLNSTEFKQTHPEAGEDVKVMGCRLDRELTLTVALAFVDRFVPDAAAYVDRKREIRQALEEHLARRLQTLDRITVSINTLDDPARGEGGMYLTVLGTSAEGGDSGQVGRGNKVNGIIALNRPMSAEAAAGKNPTNHVGKIYSLLSNRIAGKIYSTVSGLEELYVRMCSQIGKPIDQPVVVSAQLILQPGVTADEITPAVRAVIERELASLDDFTARLARGEFPVW